jgi:hypothetical protein
MTEEELIALVDQAQASYLAAEAVSKITVPVPDPGYSPNFLKFPTLTVAEIQAQWKEDRVTWDAYKRQRDGARDPFTQHLIRVSNGRIKLGWELEAGIEVGLDWGHRHGTFIAYDDPKKKDEPDNGF